MTDPGEFQPEIPASQEHSMDARALKAASEDAFARGDIEKAERLREEAMRAGQRSVVDAWKEIREED